jgi:hypothetical protein
MQSLVRKKKLRKKVPSVFFHNMSKFYRILLQNFMLKQPELDCRKTIKITQFMNFMFIKNVFTKKKLLQLQIIRRKNKKKGEKS